MKWSFSSMKQWSNCARQYHEVKVLKNFVVPDTAQTLYGKDVHTALENYVKDSTPLPKNYRKYQKAIDALIAIPGTKYTELKMGLKADRVTACDFDDLDYWVHGIADLVIVDNSVAYCVDYKTGSPRYADTKQLKLMALMIFAKFPEVKVVEAGLLFLAHDEFVPDTYVRGESEQLWKRFYEQLQLFDIYTTSGNWPANPSGLCKKYCAVTTCQYNGKRR